MTSQQEDSSPAGGTSMRVCRLMAGLDVGFAGGFAVILWFVVHARMSGDLWWSKLNVAGGFFYGANVYSMGLGKATLAGASLLIVTYALASAVFSQFAPVAGYARNALLALLYSTILQIAASRFFWPRLDPFAPSFFAFPVTLAGHLLYALSLIRFPGRFRAIAATFGDPVWTSEFLAEPADILGPEPSPAANEPAAPAADASGAGGEYAAKASDQPDQVGLPGPVPDAETPPDAEAVQPPPVPPVPPHIVESETDRLEY